MRTRNAVIGHSKKHFSYIKIKIIIKIYRPFCGTYASSLLVPAAGGGCRSSVHDHRRTTDQPTARPGEEPGPFINELVALHVELNYCVEFQASECEASRRWGRQTGFLWVKQHKKQQKK